MPGTRSVYIALTRRNAEDIIWRTLKQLNEKFGLGFTAHESKLKLHKPDGTEIALVGANSKDIAENFRGPTIPLCVIDEAASFRHHLTYLVDEVITPTLLDHQGTIAIIGTPSASCAGMFYDATTKGTQFKVHRWTLFQNPHLPHAKAWLDDYRKQKGWTEDNPVYQREWLGRWVKSDESLVYKLKSSNITNECPLKRPNYIFGVDLGHDDANALVVCAFDYGSPDLYVVDEFKKTGQTISEFADIIKAFKEEYNPITIVADTGGLGKAIVAEMNQRFQMQIKPAEKAHKFANIEIIGSDISAGKIKFLEHKTTLLRLELDSIQWDPDRPMKIDERSEDHLADAFLYAARESKHYTYEPIAKVIDTPEESVKRTWEEMERRLEEERIEQAFWG